MSFYKCKILLVILWFSPILTAAQQGIFEENSVVYRRQFGGGIIGYTNGLGGNLTWGKHVDGFKRRMINTEFSTIKHPKERKQFNPIYDDPKGYHYGKKNSVFTIKSTWGYKKVIHDKVRNRGVQVSYQWGIGSVLAFLKPVYYEILRQTDNGENFIQNEKYNGSTQGVDNILGRSSYFMGFDEMNFMPGIHTKAGINFEYADSRDRIHALEVGVVGEIYLNKLEIMATEQNQQILINFYISLFFGKKFKD